LTRRLFRFVFQAEDGIRDRNVTGVQTCARPILVRRTSSRTSGSDSSGTAYSISEKRTRRGETKTLWASSTYRRVDTVFAAKALGEGKGVVGGKRGVMSGEGRTSKKETMNNNRWK